MGCAQIDSVLEAVGAGAEVSIWRTVTGASQHITSCFAFSTKTLGMRPKERFALLWRAREYVRPNERSLSAEEQRRSRQSAFPGEKVIRERRL